MKEPAKNLTGFYAYNYREQVYVIAHIGWKRKQRIFFITYPKLDYKGTWDECIAECQVHYASTHKAKRRRK